MGTVIYAVFSCDMFSSSESMLLEFVAKTPLDIIEGMEESGIVINDTAREYIEIGNIDQANAFMEQNQIITVPLFDGTKYGKMKGDNDTEKASK